MIVVSVCLPSDALSQCLPTYLGFSYLGCAVSLHRLSRKVQLLLLTLDMGYLLPATAPVLGLRVSPHSCHSWHWTWDSSSGPPLFTLDMGSLLLAVPVCVLLLCHGHCSCMHRYWSIIFLFCVIFNFDIRVMLYSYDEVAGFPTTVVFWKIFRNVCVTFLLVVHKTYLWGHPDLEFC